MDIQDIVCRCYTKTLVKAELREDLPSTEPSTPLTDATDAL